MRYREHGALVAWGGPCSVSFSLIREQGLDLESVLSRAPLGARQAIAW